MLRALVKKHVGELAQDDLILYGGLLVAGLIAWHYLPKLAGAAAFNVANTVTDAAGNIVAGAAEGVGATLGVPLTDAQKCAAAKTANSTWNASLYCPAGDFLSWATGFQSPPSVSPAPGVQGVPPGWDEDWSGRVFPGN